VYLAYVDETGDTGALSKPGASACYALGCVMIHIDKWAGAFDQIVAFRRDLRDRLGVSVRAEIKANYLIRSAGPLRPLNLSPQQRRWIYREHLRLLQPIGAEAFGIVVDKAGTAVSGQQCFHMAWEMLLQRLERTMRARQGAKIQIVHDEGENDAVRKEARKARRYLTAGRQYGGGVFTMAFPNLIDDPIPRSSQHSYNLQFADLVAYSAWRAYMRPSPAVALVAPHTMWNEIGAARLGAVNSQRSPLAVVVRN
jgi:hypothetical protein